MIRLTIVWLVISFSLGGKAQFDVLKQQTIKNLSPIMSDLTWEKEMVGSLDERHALHLFIWTDTDQYRGAYKLENDDRIHLLEGEMGDDQITLFEYDEAQRLVGTITGDFNNFIFYGTWTDKNNLEEFSFIAYDRQSVIDNDLKSDWVKAFKNNKQHVLLKKIKDEFILQGRYEGYFFDTPVECLDLACNSFKAFITDNAIGESIVIKGSLKGQFAYIETDQGKDKEQLTLQNKISFEVADHSNAEQKIYQMVPDFEHQKLVSAWSDYTSKFIAEDSLYENTESFESSLDISTNYLDNRYYSGTIQYQNNQNSVIKEIGFWADLKKNRIKFGTDFIPRLDEVKNNVNNKLASNNIPSDFENKDYNIFSVGIEGIIVKTQTHMLYGQELVIIPHEQLSKKILK